MRTYKMMKRSFRIFTRINFDFPSDEADEVEFTVVQQKIYNLHEILC